MQSAPLQCAGSSSSCAVSQAALTRRSWTYQRLALTQQFHPRSHIRHHQVVAQAFAKAPAHPQGYKETQPHRPTPGCSQRRCTTKAKAVATLDVPGIDIRDGERVLQLVQGKLNFKRAKSRRLLLVFWLMTYLHTIRDERIVKERYYVTLPKEAQIAEAQWENSFLRTVKMLRKFNPLNEDDEAEFGANMPVPEPFDYPWDDDSEADLALFDLLRENLNFKQPEARRLLLIAWCLAFARPSRRPFFRQYYIKHEMCLFVGRHFEDSYYSLPEKQTISEDNFDSSFVSALKCLRPNPVEDLQLIVPPSSAAWPSREESQERYLSSLEEGASPTPERLSGSENGSIGPSDTSFKEWFAVRRRVSSSLVSPEAKERYLELLEASLPPDTREASGNLDGDAGPTDISFKEWFSIRRRGLNWKELIDQLALLGQPTWGSKPVLIDNLATIHSTLARTFDPNRPPKALRPPPQPKAEPKKKKSKSKSKGGSKKKGSKKAS